MSGMPKEYYRGLQLSFKQGNKLPELKNMIMSDDMESFKASLESEESWSEVHKMELLKYSLQQKKESFIKYVLTEINLEINFNVIHLLILHKAYGGVNYLFRSGLVDIPVLKKNRVSILSAAMSGDDEKLFKDLYTILVGEVTLTSQEFSLIVVSAIKANKSETIYKDILEKLSKDDRLQIVKILIFSHKVNVQYLSSISSLGKSFGKKEFMSVLKDAVETLNKDSDVGRLQDIFKLCSSVLQNLTDEDKSFLLTCALRHIPSKETFDMVMHKANFAKGTTVRMDLVNDPDLLSNLVVVLLEIDEEKKVDFMLGLLSSNISLMLDSDNAKGGFIDGFVETLAINPGLKEKSCYNFILEKMGLSSEFIDNEIAEYEQEPSSYAAVECASSRYEDRGASFLR